jgi:hypothetical protein
LAKVSKLDKKKTFISTLQAKTQFRRKKNILSNAKRKEFDNVLNKTKHNMTIIFVKFITFSFPPERISNVSDGDA